MCLPRRHLELLAAWNEADHASRRLGTEAWGRFREQATHCRVCPAFDNGEHGDMLEECRIRLLRFFIAARRDEVRRVPAAAGP